MPVDLLPPAGPHGELMREEEVGIILGTDGGGDHPSYR